MQYQSEYLSVLKTVMNAIKLFMAIPARKNLLQLGRYGCFSELTYRNLF